MARYQIIVEYDGKNHSGWQSQKNAKSIQKEIEKILSKILKIKVNIIGSGRTDAGVHSKNQSAHFDLWIGAAPLHCGSIDAWRLIKPSLLNGKNSFGIIIPYATIITRSKSRFLK